MSPIVILTALDLEFAAVHARLADVRPQRHPQGTRFELGRPARGRCEVALAQVGKGNGAAAVLAERAVNAFDPPALLLVGVAGALQRHIALGSIVVATRIYAYHGGASEPDGFKSRPQAWEAAHPADQLARQVDRDGSWAHGLTPRPKVHFGPIAAGELVVNSIDSVDAHRIRTIYNDALAVEMEGAGVAQAGHLNGKPVVVVRGISDPADGTKESADRDRWQERAVEGAAAFALALAECLYDERRETRRKASEMSDDDTTPGTTQNIAMGNARVGAQVGTIYGGFWNVRDAGRAGDVNEAFAALRARLLEAHAAGRLDDDTYAAVEDELAQANEALHGVGHRDGGRFVLAMKKLRGLISDAADLAAAATAVIGLARGSS